jgi:undecaprenyl-diphosphatase
MLSPDPPAPVSDPESRQPGRRPSRRQARFSPRSIWGDHSTVSLLQLAVLAIVQGITEFLPISSSGHLILVPHFFDWPDQGLAIDVSAHVGTLAAVLIYFWRDVGRMGAGCLKLATGRVDRGAKLALYLIVATIPALIAGFLADRYGQDALRRVDVVAFAMIGFAIVLFIADRSGATVRRVGDMTVGQALIIGICQCIAFIPGTSRSGITMVASRFMGYERTEGARFSFLMSIPAIAAAGAWEGLKLARAGIDAPWAAAGITAGLSAITGIFAIAFMMRWLRNAGFLPFVIYRLLLGGALIAYLYIF